MPQSTDVVIDGAGYMLVAGKGPEAYVRSQDGMAEGRTARISQRDFFGGSHRALQLERDRGGESTGVLPALGGQGVVPGGLMADVTLPGSATPNAIAPWPTVQLGSYVYYAVDRYVYRTTTLGATNWAAPTQVFDAGSGNAVTDLASYGGNLLMCIGTTLDVQVMPYPGGGASSTLLAGLKARYAVSYAGFAVLRDDTQAFMLWHINGSAAEVKYVDSEVLGLAVVGGRVMAPARSGLYAFSGDVRETTRQVQISPGPPAVYEPRDVLAWSGSWQGYALQGQTTDADDYRFVVGYGGRLYTWLNKSVLEHNPDGERAGWRDTGLSGIRCTGGCVAGGYLIVTIEAHDNASEIWAWDGTGWWRVARRQSTSGVWCSPIATYGVGNWDLLVLTDGSLTAQVVRLIWHSDSKHNLPTTAEYVTSMIDAGERDKDKAWRKIGAVFASPTIQPATSSVDPVTVTLAYSIDAGATWVTAATRTLTGSTRANTNFSLDAAIATDVAVSRLIQLRISWSSLAEWAPILTGVWAEFEVLDSPARRRKWSFTVKSHDQVIDREGSQMSRTGRQLIADLWTSWETGSTLTYRDLDYDAAPTTRRVRITGIREVVTRPADQGTWGDATVMLTMVEV